MIKKSLLLTLLLAILAPWVAQAQETVTIGDGTSTSRNVPIGTYYNYSITEQLYTADEIGTAGTISSISFNYAVSTAKDFPIAVYMMNTDAADLSTGISLADAELVFDGTLSVTGPGWATITLDTLFAYDGTSNLLIGINKGYVKYYNDYTWYCTGGSNVMTRYSQNDSNAYNAATASFSNSSYDRPNIQIEITPAGGATCAKPDNLIAYNEPTATSFYFSIDGGSGVYNIELKEGNGDWEPSAQCTDTVYGWNDLESNTAYQVRVQSVCTDMTNPETGDPATSGWKTLNFTTANPCAAPTNLQVSDITAESATLSWTAGYQETEWTVKYKKSTDAWENAIVETVSGTPTLALSNLDGLTTYNVQVYNCENYVSANFTTAAGIPLTEAFGSATPTGWTQYSGLLSDVMSGTALTSGSGWNFGQNGGVFDDHARTNIYGTSCKRWLVMPTLVMEDNVQLLFELAYTKYVYSGTAGDPDQNGTDDKFVVLIQTESGWEILRQWDNASSEYVLNNLTPTPITVAIDLSSYAGQNIAIAFYGESTVSNADNNLHIDNVSIDYIPACAKPTGVAASDVTAHTANISWTSDGNAWQIGYSTDGFVTEQYVEVTENPYTLTGLTPETAYQVRVQNKCSEVLYSIFTSPVSFTTDIACPAPTGLAVSNITGHEATITWTSAAEAWQICVNDDEENLIGTTDTTYTLTGLAPETAYTVKVRANCGDDGYGDWTNNVSFTTDVACPAPTGLAAALTPGNGSVATLSWTSDASAWVVAYKTADATDFTEVNVTENPYTLTSLTPETTYNAKVKAVCGGEDGESSWSNTITFTPTDAYTLTVNDGTTTNGYVPIYGYYVDYITKSQFIIPAENLADMAWGTINKMTFYAAADKNWGAAQFEVYMTETSDTTLSALADYGTMTKVKNAGSLSISGKQMVVELDAPYQYMGGNLMIGFLQTVTGTYSSCSWYGVSATGASMGGNGSSISQQNFLPKTTFDYEPGEEPSCFKPTGLAVEYTGGTEAIVSWNSDAEAWNMRVNGVDVNGVITNPYTLTGLELATTYEVEVQADCGDDGTSEWSNPVSFTTDLCIPENQCAIYYSFTDQYDDSWNGAYINIVDATTGKLLYELTMPNVTGPYEGSFNVCDGREIQFVWVSGSYPRECGYVFTHFGTTILEKATNSTAPDAGVFFTYNVNCTPDPCTVPVPYELMSSNVSYNQATLSWTGYSDSYYVQYRTAELRSGDWTEVTANTTTLDLTGLVSETTYEWQVRNDCDSIVEWSEIATFTTQEVIYWNDSTDWTVPEEYADVTIPENTTVLIPAGYTAYADEITIEGDGQIIMEPGAQLYHSNEVPVTLQLNYDNGLAKDGEYGEYRLIAAPVNPGVPVSSTGLVPESTDPNYDYVDLYYFDQNVGELVWINYKFEANDFDSLFIKKGYLYSNAQNVLGIFGGNTLPTNVDVKEPLVYNPNVLWAGWNLVGNPFTCMAFVDRPYYKINGDGDAIAQAEGNSLEVFEGVFVYTEQADDTVTFFTSGATGSNPGPDGWDKMLTLNLNDGRSLIDRAIVRFDEGRQLLKLQMGSSTKVYIPKDGSDYAIVSSDDTGEMPVSFKAENDGTYTMNFSSENISFSYLHLIDNKTGDDIDLLETPSYTFTARTNDYTNRFKLVFALGTTGIEESFAFFNNGNLVISNEGNATLQVVDVMGRILKSENINGSASVKVDAAPGVYMIRLTNGSNVKVQKVVVE